VPVPILGIQEGDVKNQLVNQLQQKKDLSILKLVTRKVLELLILQTFVNPLKILLILSLF